MFRITVAALLCNFGDALRGIGQKIPGFEKTKIDYIIHAGYLELLLIEKLEISCADMEIICHRGNIP